jgi:hypothetical protein
LSIQQLLQFSTLQIFLTIIVVIIVLYIGLVTNHLLTVPDQLPPRSYTSSSLPASLMNAAGPATGSFARNARLPVYDAQGSALRGGM